MTETNFLNEMNTELEFESNTLETTEFLSDLPVWDSMQQLVFIAKAEEKTGKVVNGPDVKKAKTVDDLLALLSDVLEKE